MGQLQALLRSHCYRDGAVKRGCRRVRRLVSTNSKFKLRRTERLVAADPARPLRMPKHPQLSIVRVWSMNDLNVSFTLIEG